MENDEKIPGIDGGVWAWLTAIACFFSLLWNGTFTYSAAILHIELLKMFEESSAYTSFIGATFSSLLYLFGPIASILINITSCRVTHCIGGFFYFLGFTLSFFASRMDHLLLTYGILGGVGTGLVATAHLVVTAYRFRKYLGYVVGVQVAGAGISLMITGPLVQGLINMYGLRGAFLLLGAIGSHQILFGLMMKPSILEIHSKTLTRNSTHPEKEEPENLHRCSSCHCNLRNSFEMFKQSSFLTILFSTFVWHIPASTLQLHLLNSAVTEGSSRSQAAMIQTTVGIGSTFGRILTGVLLGRGKTDPVLLEFGMLGFLGILTLIYPSFSNTFTGQNIYAGIYGLYTGGLTTLFSPLCFHYLKLDQIAAAIGLRYFIGGLSCIAGPPLTGLILDKGGSYAQSFYISGSFLIAAAFLDLMSTFWSRKEVTAEDIIKKDSDSVLSHSLHSLHIDASTLHRSMQSLHQTYLDSPRINRSIRSLRLLDRRGIGSSSNSLQSSHSFHPPYISRSVRSIQNDGQKEEWEALKNEEKE